MLVMFFKSDVVLDKFPEESDNLFVNLPESANVQLTYRELRATKNIPEYGLIEGDTIAYYSQGFWVTENPLDDGHWSDVVIGEME